jgi:hypothetical protein
MGQPARDRDCEDTLHATPTIGGDDAASADLVMCVMSGAWIPRAQAVMVVLGPGRRRWVDRSLTNAGR